MIANLNDFSLKAQKAIDFLTSEYNKIRVGRPSSDILDTVFVEAYGSSMPLNQVSSITVADANMILVTPWDKSLLEAIQKAIQKSNLGINPVVDNETIRLIFPSLTEEKRKDYVKLASQKAEETKIHVRQLRKEYMTFLSESKKNNDITEDIEKSEEKKLQEKIDVLNKKIDEMLKEKEDKLMKI